MDDIILHIPLIKSVPTYFVLYFCCIIKISFSVIVLNCLLLVYEKANYFVGL